MSRIGRMPIAVPAGVTVDIAENNKVTVKGPKGTLERVLPAGCKFDNSIMTPPYLFYASSTFTKCLTWATIPLVHALSGNSTVLLTFFKPSAATVALCFGIAPIVDFTKVTFNVFSAISISSLSHDFADRFAAVLSYFFWSFELAKTFNSCKNYVLLIVRS
jgi:hypothetical protein